MTDMTALRAEAALARAAASGAHRAALPCGEPQRDDIKFASEFRSQLVERDGQEFHLVEGYASTVEQRYEMWDMFGPYDEVVSRDAFSRTLAANPMVVFRFNHGGTAMATTRNGRLELEADAQGLRTRAWINPKRADVRDLITAMEDKDVTEQSFMFQITHGEWNEDFSEFRIREVDLDRGDVGPVTYGANPFTQVAARSGELLANIPDMPVLVAREAMRRLAQRTDLLHSADEYRDSAEFERDNEAAAMAAVYAERADLRDATLHKGEYVVPATQTAPEPVVRVSDDGPQMGSSIRLRKAQLEIDKQQK